MTTVAEQVLSEKVVAQARTIQTLESMVVALVWKIGQGKPVTISAGTVKEAAKGVESMDFQQLRSGELRLKVKRVEPTEGKKK